MHGSGKLCVSLMFAAICVCALGQRNAEAADYVDSLPDARIAIVTAQELIVGARDKRDVAGIDGLIASYPVMHINDRIGARVRPPQDLCEVARSPDL